SSSSGTGGSTSTPPFRESSTTGSAPRARKARTSTTTYGTPSPSYGFVDADPELSGNALAVAAKRGRLRAVRRTDQWYSKTVGAGLQGAPLQARMNWPVWGRRKIEQVSFGVTTRGR